MSRLGALILGLVAAVVGSVLAPGTPAFATTNASSPVCTYDSAAHASPAESARPERGPPAFIYDCTASSSAVGYASHGASACPLGARTCAHTTYDALASLGQGGNATGTTDSHARVDDRALSPLRRWRVAAKACSFTGTTVVLMADGTRKLIEDIEVGDKVIATDPETGEQVAKTVEHVWVHDDTVIDLIADGEVISTTEDHPFWSVTDRRFERADELDEGEKVLAADGRVLTLSGLHLGTARRALAYNLTVEGIHTYHVGQNAILVHNTCNVRGPWQITKEATAATRQGPFGPVWKSKSDGLWWSRDTAGHGGSAWKVYEESSRGLIWRADANQYGDFIVGKHKSEVGTFIPWKDLN